MKLHYGIISTATIVPRFINAVKEHGDIVEAIASRTLHKAQDMADTYHIPKAYGDYASLFADKAIDIVYIATPNHLHTTLCLEALKHGLHVIVEKPFALSRHDAQLMFETAAKQHCFIMEAQKSVFLPATLKLKEMIDQNVLGECMQIQMTSSFPGAYTMNHWMYQVYGGVLNGSASYTLEYLMFLFDDPKIEVHATMDTCDNGGAIDASMSIRLNDHMLADSHITMKVKTDNAAIFYFENGYIRVENYWKARTLEIHPYDAKEYTLNFPVEYEMLYEVQHIHECLEKKLTTSPVMSPTRTIQCVQLVEEMLKVDS